MMKTAQVEPEITAMAEKYVNEQHDAIVHSIADHLQSRINSGHLQIKNGQHRSLEDSYQALRKELFNK